MNRGLTPYGVLTDDHPVKVLAKMAVPGAPDDIKRKVMFVMTLSREACRKNRKGMHEAVIPVLEKLAPMFDGDEELLAQLNRAIEWHRGPSVGPRPRPATSTTPRTPRQPRDPAAPREPRARRTPRGPVDEVTRTLLGMSLDEMYEIAASSLGKTVEDLKQKYGHLNSGLQRMNLGNRLREQGFHKAWLLDTKVAE